MYTPIKLDKERNFRYGMKALSLVEKKLKKNIGQIDFNNLSIEETMTIVWAGLYHEDKELTVDSLMDIIDEHDIKIGAVVEAMGLAINDAFGEGGENPNQAVTSE